jgi:hypothetical protein
MGVASLASASLAPRKEPRLGLDAPVKAAKRSAPARQEVARASLTDFVLTHETEVFLDGKPCRYDKIPARASIIKMEVAADKKTVLKVHFRTRK